MQVERTSRCCQKAPTADGSGNNIDIRSAFETPPCSRRLREPGFNIQQTTLTTWTGSATVPADPSHRHTASSYTFNRRLARINLDTIGVLSEPEGKEINPKVFQATDSVVIHRLAVDGSSWRGYLTDFGV